jgi:hypothetical protein
MRKIPIIARKKEKVKKTNKFSKDEEVLFGNFLKLKKCHPSDCDRAKSLYQTRYKALYPWGSRC